RDARSAAKSEKSSPAVLPTVLVLATFTPSLENNVCRRFARSAQKRAFGQKTTYLPDGPSLAARRRSDSAMRSRRDSAIFQAILSSASAARSFSSAAVAFVVFATSFTSE